jgi:adenosylcobinamide-phosphate synthase
VVVGAPTATSVLVHGALLGLLLKPLLAWRMLSDEVIDVERALRLGVESGRTQLKRLVSRDTNRLSAAEVRESALESLAENLNDSLIAPLFWFCVGGLPGAAVYRFANTADAMWGYHGEWEWAGKWAARADDILSYIPARVTAALLAVAAWHWPARLAEVARVTPSPNGGWPMGMLALALNVRLGKPGVYVLNPAGEVPGPAQVRAGLRIAERTAQLAVAISAATAGVVTQWR